MNLKTSIQPNHFAETRKTNTTLWFIYVPINLKIKLKIFIEQNDTKLKKKKRDQKPLYIKACAKSLQTCLTLCNPIDYSPPGSSVHGILQVRILEWVAMLSSRESFWARDWTHISCVSCRADEFFTAEPLGKLTSKHSSNEMTIQTTSNKIIWHATAQD